MVVSSDAKLIQALRDQLTELERLVKCKYVEAKKKPSSVNLFFNIL